MKAIIVLSLVLSVFFLIPGNGIIITHACTSYMIIALLGLYVLLKDKRYLPEKCLYSYILISFAYFVYKAFMFEGRLSIPMVTEFTEISLFGVYYIILLKELKPSNVYKYTIIGCTTVVAGYMLFQIFGLDPLFGSYTLRDRASGVFGNPTDSGTYLVVCLPFFLNKRFWLLSIIVCLAILCSFSVTAYGTMFVVFILYAWFKDRKVSVLLFILCLLCIALAAWFKPGFIGTTGRAVVWKEALSNSNWLFGRGLGGFKVAGFSYGALWHRPQSVWIWLLYNLGLTGVGLFSWFVVDTLRKVSNKPVWLSLAASLVMASMNITYHLWPIVLIVGLNLVILKKEE